MLSSTRTRALSRIQSAHSKLPYSNPTSSIYYSNHKFSSLNDNDIQNSHNFVQKIRDKYRNTFSQNNTTHSQNIQNIQLNIQNQIPKENNQPISEESQNQHQPEEHAAEPSREQHRGSHGKTIILAAAASAIIYGVYKTKKGFCLEEKESDDQAGSSKDESSEEYKLQSPVVQKTENHEETEELKIQEIIPEEKEILNIKEDEEIDHIEKFSEYNEDDSKSKMDSNKIIIDTKEDENAPQLNQISQTQENNEENDDYEIQMPKIPEEWILKYSEATTSFEEFKDLVDKVYVLLHNPLNITQYADDEYVQPFIPNKFEYSRVLIPNFYDKIVEFKVEEAIKQIEYNIFNYLNHLIGIHDLQSDSDLLEDIQSLSRDLKIYWIQVQKRVEKMRDIIQHIEEHNLKSSKFALNQRKKAILCAFLDDLEKLRNEAIESFGSIDRKIQNELYEVVLLKLEKDLKEFREIDLKDKEKCAQVQAKKSKFEKLQSKLDSLKFSKELLAVLNKIETARNENSSIKGDILELEKLGEKDDLVKSISNNLKNISNNEDFHSIPEMPDIVQQFKTKKEKAILGACVNKEKGLGYFFRAHLVYYFSHKFLRQKYLTKNSQEVEDKNPRIQNLKIIDRCSFLLDQYNPEHLTEVLDLLKRLKGIPAEELSQCKNMIEDALSFSECMSVLKSYSDLFLASHFHE